MRLLAFSLSLRKDSCNKKLIKIVENIIKEDKVEIEILDMLDYDIPSYNQDIQDNKGFPVLADKFRDKLSTADGLIIASPEYNYSYPGFFKNMFDWISRYQPMPWRDKKILFLSASPALAGGERGLWALRVPFEGCGSIVFPGMFSLPLAYQAFDNKGNLIEDKVLTRLKELVKSYMTFVKKLS